MTAETPAAVLWDMDGTLVDTEPYWMAAERELVFSYGGEWTAEDGLTVVGQGLEHSATILKSRGVELSVEQIIDRLTSRVLAQAMEELPWRPGALELLIETREAGFPTALVTMSMKPLANRIATALDRPLFDVIVTGDDVERPKPYPDAYERAAQLLDVDIASCIAIEDSIPGLASATTAGAVTVGVQAHVELPEAPEYTLWPTLAGRTINDLVNLFRSRTGQPALREDLM